MNPLFEVSLFAYLVLRFRAWDNLRHERHGIGLPELYQLRMDLRMELTHVQGRGVLDTIVRSELWRRIRKVEVLVDEYERMPEGPGGFSFHYFPPPPFKEDVEGYPVPPKSDDPG